MSFEFRPMRSVIFVDVVKEKYRPKLLNWLYSNHIQDSISKFGPYVTKYAFYNAFPMPPEGERFGTRRMQMTEHYWLINEMTPEMQYNAITEYFPKDVLRWQGNVPDTDAAAVGDVDGDTGRNFTDGAGGCEPFVFAHVPINWEEDFKGQGRLVKDGPNYRWQFVIKYPDSITVEAGEKWFHDAFVPYFAGQADVHRLLSSRIMQDVVGCPYQRLVEMWFDSEDEWYATAVAGTKNFPKPAWAQQDQFPFLKPQTNITGMFLPDIATIDNLTQYHGYITMR